MKKKSIKLFQVRPGEHFIHDGVEYVKLDESAGATFALGVEATLKNVQFESDDAEREDHNNYIGSNLEREGIRWLREQHPDTFDAVVERPIDLTTMDGMTDYGMPLASVRALTIDEYRKYRHLIPLTDEPYWLATGWTTKRSPGSVTNNAYYIDTGGSVNYDNVYFPYFAARPALYLKSSILVSVDAEEAEKVLADYTDSDLIDELYRRRRATYDPD
jgi:hypothetical protein